jgi:hypothetical protein
VINSFQNKSVTIQHANQSIIILTQCALHQLVHTLPQTQVPNSSAKLQDRLVKHYVGFIVIHTQRGHGMSNLVFSVKLSLGDAIAAIFSHAPVVINSFQNKSVTIQHANQSIIILTQCALHQLVHTLTGCTFMYFKIFLGCFILTKFNSWNQRWFSRSQKSFSDDTITWKIQRISTRRHRYLLIYQVTRQAS